MNSTVSKEHFCDLCSLQFGKKSIYDMHLKAVHNKAVIKSEQNLELSKNKFKNIISFAQSIDFCESTTKIKQEIDK